MVASLDFDWAIPANKRFVLNYIALAECLGICLCKVWLITFQFFSGFTSSHLPINSGQILSPCWRKAIPHTTICHHDNGVFLDFVLVSTNTKPSGVGVLQFLDCSLDRALRKALNYAESLSV